MSNFKEYVSYDLVIKQCEEKNACTHQLKQLKNSESSDEFYRTITDNIQ